ncbi:MAG: hypothetical protein GX573_16465 [Chloroflexi bacterium]|nr:hypothetical protein [Chloroflexota bacterium]
MDAPKLRGGVLLAADRDSHSIIALLTFHVREALDLVYYQHPSEINVENRYDFLVALSSDDLAALVHYYQMRAHALPLLVHIDQPEVLYQVQHEALFPGVEVLRIPQANLSQEPDVTLELRLLDKIIDRLQARH